jgi:ascorbate-specific PTS system EIIC-type component UlaA
MKGLQAGTDSHYIYKYMSSSVFSQGVWLKISPAFTGVKVNKVTREKGIAIMEMEEN